MTFKILTDFWYIWLVILIYMIVIIYEAKKNFKSVKDFFDFIQVMDKPTTKEKKMSQVSAKGKKGILIYSIDGMFFRVYDKKYKEGFKDFTIKHTDLSIIIDDDEAIIDEEGEFIDHSNETLGLD